VLTFFPDYLLLYEQQPTFAFSCFIVETSLQKYMRCKSGCFPSLGPDQPAEVVDEAPRSLVRLIHIYVIYNIFNVYLLAISQLEVSLAALTIP
jgi:hypothetical protein